jgi:hypothetical protein
MKVNQQVADNGKSKSPSGSKFNFFQPKLTVNQPNDVYEQEADSMADYAMSIPEPMAKDNVFTKPEARVVQRKCAHCEDEQKKMLSRKETGDATAFDTSLAESALQSPGEKLDRADRRFMEQRFGYDFGGVQIHNDTLAHQSSANIQAKAYTSDNHIVFGQGNYQPGTDSGRHLLAHELTHVVQQSNIINQKQLSRKEAVVTEGDMQMTKFYQTTGNIQHDVDFFKSCTQNFTRAIIVMNSIAMIYKIDDAKPIHLKAFNIKKDIRLLTIYHMWGNDGTFYPLVYDSDKGYQFAGKGIPKTEEQKKAMAGTDAMYDISNWFISEADKKSFQSLFDNEGTALIVMPYSGGESKSEKSESEDQNAIPPRPKWADTFEKSMADEILTAHRAEPSSEDIPDKCKLYYSKSKSQWRAYADQIDATSKTPLRVYLNADEKSNSADILANVRQLIRIEKLKSVKDIKPTKDAQVLSNDLLWAVELKLKIEKLIAEENKANSNHFDLPDKISLTNNDGDTNIYLRISVFATGKTEQNNNETQIKSGVLPDPLQKTMKPEDLLIIVKTATKALKGGDIKEEGRDTKNYENTLNAYPSNIIATDVRPDGISVTNAHHEFKMDVQMEKLDEGTLNQMTARMRTIYYYWDIYKVSDQLTEEQNQELPTDWKDRRDQLAAYFKNSAQLKTKPFVNTEKLNMVNKAAELIGEPKVDTAADISRQSIEKLKSAGVFYGSQLSITPEADFSFPRQEGDYLVYCRAQVEPTEKVFVRPSEAFFTINLQDGTKLAQKSVDKPFNEIDDTKKQLAEATTDEEKKRLQDKLDSLTKRQESSLADRLTSDISSTDDNIRLAKKLKNLYLTNKGSTKPFSLILTADTADGKKLLDLWTMLSLSEPTKALDTKIDALITNLSAQGKGFADVQKNLNEFSKDYDHSKPTYTPVVSLISEETGQEYQLITMIGETKYSSPDETKVVLIDVTTHKTQRKYSGSSTNKDRATALQEAIQDAFNEFGKECEYGRGSLRYRIPILNIQGGATSKPGIKKRVIGILETVAAVAGIAALIIGTVATGGALAVALGVGSAVVGAGVAGYHIYDRAVNHKLEPDAELAMDILNVLGPLLVGLNAAAKAAKMASLGTKAVEIAGAAKAVTAANTFLKLEKGIAMVQKLELATNFFVINYKTVKDLNEIQDANLPPEQKEALEKQILVNAVLANVMIAVAVRNEVNAKAAPGEEQLNELINNTANEQKYRRRLQSDGLIDAEGKWTIPELNESAAKNKTTEPDSAATPKDDKENTAPENKDSSAAPAPKAINEKQHTVDEYETGRKVKMKGHETSPDGEHEVEVYKDGTVGRCSPAAPGTACPLLQIQFKTVLDERPVLKNKLQTLMKEIAAFGENVPAPKLKELAEFEQHLRMIETTSKTSAAPSTYKVKEIDYTDEVDLPSASEKTILEYPYGERVWRNPDGSVSHEAIIGGSVGRKGLEKEQFTGTETELSSMGKYERAHSFGQGFGWESPYALRYAPRKVNQEFQNRGIEGYIRAINKALPSGQKLIVETETTTIPLTNRLQSIKYEAFMLTAGGEKIKAFDYKIEISGTRDVAIIDTPAISYSNNPNPANQKLLTDMRAQTVAPDIITKPQHVNAF